MNDEKRLDLMGFGVRLGVDRDWDRDWDLGGTRAGWCGCDGGGGGGRAGCRPERGGKVVRKGKVLFMSLSMVVVFGFR